MVPKTLLAVLATLTAGAVVGRNRRKILRFIAMFSLVNESVLCRVGGATVSRGYMPREFWSHDRP